MKKRILFIATSSINSRSGGGLANRALYNALEAQYPGMVDVVMQEDGNQYPDNFFIMKRAPLLKRVVNTLLCKTGHGYNSFVLDLIDSNKGLYSNCIINVGILGSIIPHLHKRGLKVATVHHNYEPEFQRDNKRPSTFWGLTTKSVEKDERMAFSDSDMNLFLTKSDLEKFNSEYGQISKGRDYVIGIFDAEPHEKKIDGHSLPREKLVICGSLCSVQTVAGIRVFEKMCLPVLHDYYKDNFTLTLTGRSPGDYIHNLVKEDRNLNLVASPQDISEVVYQSGIFICPTNVGGGLKLRILDGLKLGLPIITHEISARGYDMFFDKDWFQVYNDEESFRKALIKINELITECPNIRQEILNDFYNAFSFSEGKRSYIEHIEEFLCL